MSGGRLNKQNKVVQLLKNELISAHANIADLEHINKCVSIEVSFLKSSAE